MHLLYCDESGSVNEHQHFVLAGVSLFERQTHWVASELDKIAARFNPADPTAVELHGNHMLQGKGIWRSFPTDIRIQAIKDTLSILAQSHKTNRVFACIINKIQAPPKDPVELAFEQIASRFDQYLMRLHRANDSQRGIIIFDKSTVEVTVQNLATDFRTIGHSWGVLRNLAEVPLFLDSKASRLIQLADVVAYAFFRKYERGDDRFASIITDRIDQEGGIVYGLSQLL